MEKNEIFQILNDWNFWEQKLDIGIKREKYLQKLNKFLDSEKIIVIKGPRRSGKSYLMRQLAWDLINNGVLPKRILMINFEDPRFGKLDTDYLQKIYEIYLEFVNPKEKPYLFLDEIQEVRNWEKWVLMMQELKKGRIIISGSNAKLLSQELSTLLTGRHLDLLVFPLAFKEFLKFNQIKIADDLDLIKNRLMVKNFFNQFFQWGGFPEVVLEENKKEILLGYFEDILEKDLFKRYKIRRKGELKELLRFYLSNISSLISFNSLEKFLGISSDTIEKFSSYLEDVFLLFFLKRFSFRVKEQEKSPKKVYVVDLGLANNIGFKFSRNEGKLAENLIFLEFLRKKTENLFLELYYWKDQLHREVDFVLKEKEKIIGLYQSCFYLKDFQTKEREIKSLLKASKELSCENLWVINQDYDGEELIKGKKIKYISLVSFLLKNSSF